MDVNLLPYREKQRKANKQLLMVTLSACGFIFLILVFIIHRTYSVEIDKQTRINQLLHQAGSSVMPAMNQLADIEKEKAQIASKVNQLKELETKRYQTVKLFNIITDITPEGIVYNQINRELEQINLAGEAEKNQEVATLLKSIDDNNLFFNASLSEAISTAAETNNGANKTIRFKLTFNLVEKKLTPPAKLKQK